MELYFVKGQCGVNIMVERSEFFRYIDELEYYGCEIESTRDGHYYIVNRGEEKIKIGYTETIEN